MAEEIGFEPTVGYPTLTFQASTLNHSDTLPKKNYTKQIYKRVHLLTNHATSIIDHLEKMV